MCPRAATPMDSLPRAVVKVRVPRGPGAVEGERQLLVVLVLLTPHPKGREHLVCTPQRPDCQAMRGPHKRRGALPCAGGARQQESTPSSAAAGFYPARAPRRHRAAGRQQRLSPAPTSFFCSCERMEYEGLSTRCLSLTPACRTGGTVTRKPRIRPSGTGRQNDPAASECWTPARVPWSNLEAYC